MRSQAVRKRSLRWWWRGTKVWASRVDWFRLSLDALIVTIVTLVLMLSEVH